MFMYQLTKRAFMPLKSVLPTVTVYGLKTRVHWTLRWTLPSGKLRLLISCMLFFIMIIVAAVYILFTIYLFQSGHEVRRATNGWI